ncbi:MAG: hypothetical protein AB8B61_03010, partial [Cyclobacteriaceae bacterium]
LAEGGTSADNYGLKSQAIGGVDAIGLYATASGATNNYAAIFDQGNVGIGTTSPDQNLHIYDAAGPTVMRLERSTGPAVIQLFKSGTGAVVRDWTIAATPTGFVDITYSTDDFSSNVSLMRLQDDKVVIKSELELDSTIMLSGANSEINRTTDGADETGGYHLLPIAYGTIDGDGTVDNATPNVSVSYVSLGVYDISITDYGAGSKDFITNSPVVNVTIKGGDFGVCKWDVQPTTNIIRIETLNSSFEISNIAFSFVIYMAD